MHKDSGPGRNRRTSRPRELVLRALLGLALTLFVAGGFASGWFFLSRASSLAQAPSREKLVGADTGSVVGAPSGGTSALPARQPSDPRYAFLLLGYGGGGHDGAYLTDSMMVVIVDPAQKTLTLLSLPRDAWVPLVFSDRTTVYNKVNTAYAFAIDKSLYTDRLPRYQGSQGAGTFAMDTVSRLLGIPISYYLGLDFAGFREVIDAVGGIDVDVPDAFSANYPANDNSSINPSWTVVRFAKGMQHMSGERAIEYARARETIDNPSEGSDFARSRRQRLIMEAFKTRLFQPSGLIHIPQLLAIASGHVDTNYSLPSAVQLAQLAVDWRDVRFYQTALTNANYLVDGTGPEGTYILVPQASGRSWAQIQAFCQRLWQNPALGVVMAGTEVVVENDTGVAGVAGRVSDVLAALGYRVGTPTTGATRGSPQVVDRTGGDPAMLIGALEGDLHVKLGDGDIQAGGGAASGGITLEVGSDDASLADLVVTPDTSVPKSSVGVARAGSWSAEAPAPVPAAAPVAPGGPTSRGRVAQATPTATMERPAGRLTGTPRVATPVPANPTVRPRVTTAPTPSPIARSSSAGYSAPTSTARLP